MIFPSREGTRQTPQGDINTKLATTNLSHTNINVYDYELQKLFKKLWFLTRLLPEASNCITAMKFCPSFRLKEKVSVIWNLLLFASPDQQATIIAYPTAHFEKSIQ